MLTSTRSNVRLPLRIPFLADWWLTRKGLRSKREIAHVRPLSGAFTKPIASRYLSELLEKKIKVASDFLTARIDPHQHSVIAWDGRQVQYNILVTVPTIMGSEAIINLRFGDDRVLSQHRFRRR